MFRKTFVALAAVLAATMIAPTASFAKKSHKAHKCNAGQFMSGPVNSFGWSPIMQCNSEGKMQPTGAMCFQFSGMCPPIAG